MNLNSFNFYKRGGDDDRQDDYDDVGGKEDEMMKGAFAAMKLTVCMDGFREISRCQNGVNSFVFCTF